jgi:hypothetical protein
LIGRQIDTAATIMLNGNEGHTASARGVRRRADAELIWMSRAQVTSKEATDRPLIVCASCGKEFRPTRSDARYCSNRCRQQAHRIAHAE